MTLAFNPAGDFADITDGLVTVTVTAVLPTGTTPTTGVSALQRAVDLDAMQMFGGIGIEPDDTIWHFATTSISGRVQNGDKITTAGGDVWIVIAAKVQTLSSRWRCLCRLAR